jgi:very-short-patch-repair endonuclease
MGEKGCRAGQIYVKSIHIASKSNETQTHPYIRSCTTARQRAAQSMTQAECILWERLRDRRLAGIKFRRQHSIGAYNVDFYCAAARLIIEVDGGNHL